MKHSWSKKSQSRYRSVWRNVIYDGSVIRRNRLFSIDKRRITIWTLKNVSMITRNNLVLKFRTNKILTDLLILLKEIIMNWIKKDWRLVVRDIGFLRDQFFLQTRYTLFRLRYFYTKRWNGIVFPIKRR